MENQNNVFSTLSFAACLQLRAYSSLQQQKFEEMFRVDVLVYGCGHVLLIFADPTVNAMQIKHGPVGGGESAACNATMKQWRRLYMRFFPEWRG